MIFTTGQKIENGTNLSDYLTIKPANKRGTPVRLCVWGGGSSTCRCDSPVVEFIERFQRWHTHIISSCTVERFPISRPQQNNISQVAGSQYAPTVLHM